MGTQAGCRDFPDLPDPSHHTVYPVFKNRGRAGPARYAMVFGAGLSQLYRALLYLADDGLFQSCPARYRRGSHDGRPERSEAHTSELQSLMRSSYAVFCLKKKTTNTHPTTQQRTTN